MKQQTYIYQGEGERVDKYIAAKISDITRTQVQLMIDDHLILVNQKSIKANYNLKPNDEITVMFVEAKPTNIVAQSIPLDIYYEDTDIIVINKPSGMVVHPAPGNYDNTLVNALLFHCQDLSGINGQIRAGIVHRIDKDTSGLLVVCKNDFSHKKLSKQFADKKITRKYLAICHGVITHNLGKIDAPIGRNPQNRQQMAVIEGGKHAITHFKVVKRYAHHTLVEMNLETGRTHQIRVHMKYIGHPLVGDPLYGPKKTIDEHGQYLHAKTLGFQHPRTNIYMEYESPLPDYFEEKLMMIANES